MAGELATDETVGFIVRHSSGVICVSVPDERLQALQLPPMCVNNEDPKGTAFTVSVDAKSTSTSTGISRPTGPRPSAHLRTRTASQPTSTGPVTSSRCDRVLAAYWSATGTPRQRSTCVGSRACSQLACCARCAMTTAPWRASHSSSFLPGAWPRAHIHRRSDRLHQGAAGRVAGRRRRWIRGGGGGGIGFLCRLGSGMWGLCGGYVAEPQRCRSTAAEEGSGWQPAAHDVACERSYWSE